MDELSVESPRCEERLREPHAKDSLVTAASVLSVVFEFVLPGPDTCYRSAHHLRMTVLQSLERITEETSDDVPGAMSALGVRDAVVRNLVEMQRLFEWVIGTPALSLLERFVETSGDCARRFSERAPVGEWCRCSVSHQDDVRMISLFSARATGGGGMWAEHVERADLELTKRISARFSPSSHRVFVLGATSAMARDLCMCAISRRSDFCGGLNDIRRAAAVAADRALLETAATGREAGAAVVAWVVPLRLCSRWRDRRAEEIAEISLPGTVDTGEFLTPLQRRVIEDQSSPREDAEVYDAPVLVQTHTACRVLDDKATSVLVFETAWELAPVLS